MSEVLYRKYRPQNFDDILGQDPIKKTLKSAIENDSISHAYIFSGPRGTGKTSVARIFARAINDLNDDEKNNLDIIEIDAASNRGIEEVRELRHKVSFAPSNLKYKVYIIDEVHMLTKEAFNALLKTLEEPPSHAVFILATTEIHKVPITVLSRTQRFDFKLASSDEVISKLKLILKKESREIDDEGLSIIVGLGRGSFRDTETILEKVLNSDSDKKLTKEKVREILGISSEEIIERFIDSIINADIGIFDLVSQLENSGINISFFYSQVLEKLRKLLVKSFIQRDKSVSQKKLVIIISILLEGYSKMKSSPSELLTLELAISKIFEKYGQETNSSEMIKKVEPVKIVKDTQIKRKEPKVEKKEEVVKEEEEAVEEPIVKEEKVVIAVDGNISLDEIVAQWSNIMEGIRPHNHHLVAFLNKAKPFEVRGDVLAVKVGYKFHKQRIEQKKSQEALSKVLKNIFSIELRIECELDDSLKTDDTDAPPAIDTNEKMVEELFGDEV